MVEPRRPSSPSSFMISRSKLLVPVGLEHAGHQLVLGIAARRVADQPLFFAELGVEEEGVFPLELGLGGCGRNSYAVLQMLLVVGSSLAAADAISWCPVCVTGRPGAGQACPRTCQLAVPAHESYARADARQALKRNRWKRRHFLVRRRLSSSSFTRSGPTSRSRSWTRRR